MLLLSHVAQRHHDSAFTLMVINKTDNIIPATVSLAGFTPTSSAKVYRYSTSNLTAIVPQADQAMTLNGFVASFPANSMTMVEMKSGLILPLNFYLPLVRK